MKLKCVFCGVPDGFLCCAGNRIAVDRVLERRGVGK